MSKLKIMSLNCRGMASRNKRIDLFSKWLEGKYDMILLQDTHWTPESLIVVKEEWNRKFFSSTLSSNSRGTSILINNTFEFNIGNIRRDEEGNYIILELLLPHDNNIAIGSVYGPNSDNKIFYQELDQIVTSFSNPMIIIGGDWNSTRNFNIDNNNYKAPNNQKNANFITRIINKHNLVDIWRLKIPNKRRYTWLQGVSDKQARLDFFLCSEEFTSICTEEDILYKYRSDHAPITITITQNEQPRGAGAWKFNNSLIKDEKFVKLIKEEIRNIKLAHSATPCSQEYVYPRNSGIEFLVDPILFWESLMATLRGIIVSYSIHKNKDKKNKQKDIEQKVKLLDLHISKGGAKIEDFQKLLDLNNSLIDLRQEKLNGAFIRSRAEWHELGKKPSKYFLDLENKNKINKTINEIQLDDNSTINDQHKILEELRKLYAKLYSTKNLIINEDYNPNISPAKLSQTQKDALEEKITLKELEIAVKSLKNNKAPRHDGFSSEFYKKNWPQLEHFFLNYVNKSYKLGLLSSTLLEGTITCLPKNGKARNLIKNWRSISLLNTSYKIISTCITNRLRPLLKN